MFPILLVNFTGTLGFSIVLPFLVFVVAKFGGNAMIYGITGAVYPVFQLIGAPILGRWSDIYGRKKILLLSQGGTVIGWIIFIIAMVIPVSPVADVNSNVLGAFIITVPILMIFLARTIDGITGGNISIANAYLADISDDKDRNKNFGKMSVSANLGFIAGPAIAGLLGSTVYAELIPVSAALIISFVTALLILFYLPDSKPVPYYEKEPDIKKVMGFENKECHGAKSAKDIKLKEILNIPFIKFIFSIYFLIFLGFNFYYTAFPVHAAEKLHWSISQIGIYFSALSFAMVIVQGPVLSAVSKRFQESRLVIAGNFLLGICFLMLLSDNIIVIYSSTLFFAFGNGLMWPSVLSILSKVAGRKYQGTVQGYASSLGSLASIAGLITGGILYSTLGNFTFLISSATIYLVFLLSFKLLKIQAICDKNTDIKL